ncbi:MAG TPA: TetR/AcrR family transcriptional regulator [Chthonomonadaceae bacterium]|nr:TetR/AcrR family transcriptional regulator [Chthonomonadaceae bacterium]
MPKRDEKEFEERRTQILDGALEAFSTKGYAAATNRDIARAAGIGSPGLIYHYFKDKEALLHAALERHAPLLQLIAHEKEFHALPPETALRKAGTAYLQMMQSPSMAAFVRLLVGEAVRRPALANTCIEIGPRRGLEFLSRYLAAQMDAGTLRRVDPGLAARSFIGPLVLAKIAQVILPQPNALAVDGEALLDAHLEIFLRGMRADGGAGE